MSEPKYRDISNRAKKIDRLVHPVYRFFDTLFSPPYNPFYRAGTVASLLLVALIVSGLILLCFYSVSEPYESVARLQGQPFFGRWLRAFHRYSTVGAMVFALLHFLQMIIQSKSRGPWVLAWISGIILIGVLFISGWTGYVMVWDSFGQLMAMSGADLLKIVPFLREPLSQAFDGSASVGPSFFFMNLFLHVALPLGMFVILWIHLARLSRPVWFPQRVHSYVIIGIFLVVSLIWAAPLPHKADLLKIVGVVPADIVYGFWIPIAGVFESWAIILGILVIVLFFLSFPWWWDRTQYPSSIVNEVTCTGCTQCVRDCPYSAIQMVPREDGSRLLAVVDSRICVSCGVCSASCDDKAIGPPHRDGNEQLQQLEGFFKTAHADATESVVICRHSHKGVESWLRYQTTNRNLILYPVDCCGALHRDVLVELLNKVPRVFVHACPTGNCLNRDAYSMFTERLQRRRVPFLPKNFDMSRIRVSSGDFEDVIDEYTAHMRGEPSRVTSHIITFLRFALGIFLCVGIAALSQITVGTDPEHGIVRVSARLVGIAKEQCRPLNDSERMGIPKHMQQKEICETRSSSYEAVIHLNEERVFAQTYSHLGIRGDSPLYISGEIHVPPGVHPISVHLKPLDTALEQIKFQSDIAVGKGQVVLIRYNPTTKLLEEIREEGQ